MRLFLSLLGVAHDERAVDLRAGEHKQPPFLALNPLGQIPVLQDGETVLRDSTAILVYLARRFDPEGRWLPADPLGAARVQEWLSVAVNEIQAGPNVMRLVRALGVALDYAAAAKTTRRLFDDVLEPHLRARDWLAADRATIADVACYSYLALAPEGGFDLAPYPAVRAWLGRVEALDGFIPMPPRG